MIHLNHMADSVSEGHSIGGESDLKVVFRTAFRDRVPVATLAE